MRQHSHHSLAALGAALLGLAWPAAADVIGDGTLGPASEITEVGGHFTIPHTAGAFGGDPATLAGRRNLFHSFLEFNLSAAQSATFTADGVTGIENVIGRIRDVNGSYIDGLVASEIPGANLFLINPYGVVFGENARLQVSGSFYAGTADFVDLGDGLGRFDATHIENTVLSVAPPTAFGFLGEMPPARIQVLGSQLEVPEGETLGLVGGDLDIEGDGAGTTLGAPGGRIDLASVASAGEVVFGGDVAEPLLDVSGFDELGAIGLSEEAALSTRGDPGGVVVIRGGEFTMASRASIDSSSTGDADHPGNGLDAEVRGSFAMNDAWIDSSIFEGEGNAGSIWIRAGSLEMAGAAANPSGTSITSQQKFVVGGDVGRGDTGEIHVHADGLVSLTDRALIRTETFRNMPGAGGDVEVVAQRLEVHDGSQIRANARGEGRGGNIGVTADEVLLENDASLGVTGLGAFAHGSGDGGSITVTADSVDVLDGAEISTPTFGEGRGGSVHMIADELNVAGAGAGVFATVGSFGSGDGGDVVLDVRDVDVDDFGRIATFTFLDSAGGNAGDVRADSETIRVANGGFISASTFAAGFGGRPAGDAGRVILETGLLDVSNRGAISSDSRGPGNANLIDVDADRVRLTGGGVITSNALSTGDGARVEVDARRITIEGAGELVGAGDQPFSFSGISSGGLFGAPGSIEVNAEHLDVLRGGKIATQNLGPSEAGGSIRIRADRVTVAGAYGDSSAAASAITSDSAQYLSFPPATGPAGDITITGRDGTHTRLLVDDGGEISSRTRTTGAGGNVFVEFDKVKIENGGLISVESTGTAADLGEAPGDAGNIEVIGHDLIRVVESAIIAVAEEADGGNIKLTSEGTVYLRDALISAAVGGGAGSGGNVDIDPEFVVLDGSTISASAIGGDGGNITIVSDYFFATPDSVLTATSELRNDGEIVVDSPETDIVSQITALPESYLDAAALLRERCGTQRGDVARGSFVVTGRDGIPAGPDGFLSAPLGDGEAAGGADLGRAILWRNPETQRVAFVTPCPREQTLEP